MRMGSSGLRVTVFGVLGVLGHIQCSTRGKSQAGLPSEGGVS